MSKAKDRQIALIVFILASAAILLTRFNGGIALLWIANAPLIAHLCATKPNRWPAILSWAAPAAIAAGVLFGPVLWTAPILALGGIAEAVLAAALLRRFLPDRDFFESSGTVVVFMAIAGLLAPLASGVVGASMVWLTFGRPWGLTYIDWVVGHGLGTLLLSPIVALVQDRGRNIVIARLLPRLWGEGGALLLAVAATTLGVFMQERLPLLFLPALPILLATFKLGRPGAALSIAIVAVIGWVATANGHGPVMMVTLSHANRFQLFEFYLAATFLMLLPAAGALEQRDGLLLALETSEARHRRIVERSQDVIFETDAEGRWTFLSEAWLRMTGCDPVTSLGQRSSFAIVAEDWLKLQAAAAGHARGTKAGIGQAEVRFDGRGGLRWATVNVGLLRDATGTMIGSYGTISDITERKRAEADIVDSERRYRVLADNTSDMIARIGLDGTFLSVTPASQQLLGVPPEELVGKPSTELVLPEYVALIRSAHAALLDGAGDQTCSYRQYRRGGDPLWVESAFRLLRDDDDRPCEFIVSMRDISARKLLEAEAAAAFQRARDSNRLFSMAGALAAIGHWRFAIGGSSIFWSNEVFRIHGLSVGEPPTFDDAMNFYHPDDRARVSDLIATAIAERGSFDFGARIFRADGAVRDIVAQGQAEFGEGGEMIGMFGVFQDVTERARAEATLRDSEARFRLITEQASDIIALIDLEGTCLFMSPASAVILGTAPEAMVGTKPAERLHPDDLAAVIAYRVALRDETSTRAESVRFRMRRADGNYAWMEASSRLGEIGGVACVVSVWRDVSSQVAIEAELKSAKTEAEAASVAKAGFLANMSHEIRTPMNGVIGFAELLLASDLSPSQRRDAMLIADSGKAMMKLLNDILDLSKIEAGQLDTVAEPFDLPHAVRACAKLLAPGAAQKTLRFDVCIADDVPRYVVGDGLRVRQIVLNLVGNAIKFTEHGTVTLSVGLIEEAETPWLAITVRDTGIGIAPERRDSIFEEFVQADHSITRRYGGSGLGLAISNRLAKLMGGRISLESIADHGTTVTLMLPLTVAVAPVAPHSADNDLLVPPVTRPCRILLAEDHEVNQLLVTAMLDRGGHEVVLVENGLAALEAVRTSFQSGTPFDMVLMDMQMPVMDGLAATKAIRAMEAPGLRRLPIVALTANAFASDLDNCRAVGMDDHISKPVPMEVLLATVHRWSAPATKDIAPSPKPSKFQPSAAAQGKYAEHRSRTLDHIDALLQRATFTDDEVQAAAELLHKLAGTAGMFGQTTLGDRASEFEDGLRSWPEEQRPTRIVATAALLRDAA